MTTSTLVLGNKNYSSWSMRGWLVVKQGGIEFDEVVIPLDRPETAGEIRRYSPSGLVPVLITGERVVWDSLAILLDLAERMPASGLWPGSADGRTLARSIMAEMHAGFRALRTHMPMNIRARRPGRGRGEGVDADIERITAIWRDCRSRFGGRGPFLFGKWCGADAFYAPVATRFATYAVALDETCQAYVDAVLAHPWVAEWSTAARAEPWQNPKYDDI